MLLFLGFPFGVNFFVPPAYSPLSLSPMAAHLLWWPLLSCLRGFLSVAAVLYLLLPISATGVVSSC